MTDFKENLRNITLVGAGLVASSETGAKSPDVEAAKQEKIVLALNQEASRASIGAGVKSTKERVDLSTSILTNSTYNLAIGKNTSFTMTQADYESAKEGEPLSGVLEIREASGDVSTGRMRVTDLNKILKVDPNSPLMKLVDGNTKVQNDEGQKLDLMDFVRWSANMGESHRGDRKSIDPLDADGTVLFEEVEGVCEPGIKEDRKERRVCKRVNVKHMKNYEPAQAEVSIELSKVRQAALDEQLESLETEKNGLSKKKARLIRVNTDSDRKIKQMKAVEAELKSRL